MANKDAILSLRVFVQKTGATKVMRFASDMSVAECLKEINEKSGIEGGADHGLYLPPNKETGKKGCWLAKNRALRFYGIYSNATLEYKKMHRPLRIKLMDDTSKMVIIDDSASVREISDQIGEKIGLKSAEEFCLRKPLAPGMSKAPTWLNEQQTLHEQDIAEDEELVYAKKYFYSDDNVDKDDPFTLHLLYVEANKAIIESKYPVNRTDAKDFAALQMQIVYGDHNPDKHKLSFIDPDVFLPMQYRKDKKILEDVLRDHKKLTGMKDMNAKYRYVQLVRSLKTYGITFFECSEKLKNKKKPQLVLIGVTRDKIMKVDPETQKTIKEWTLEQMRRWSYAHGTFTLDFGDYEDDYITVVTEEGEAMSQLIAGYIDIILKTRVDTERNVENDDDDVAREEMMEGQFGIANVGMTSSFTNPYGAGAAQGTMIDPGQQYARQHPGPQGFPVGSAGDQPPGSSTGQMPVPQSQRVNVVDMGSAVKQCRLLATELGQGKGKFGAPGRLTEEEWRKQFNAHQAKLNGQVNDLLQQAKMSPSSMNRNQLDQKAKEIAMEMNNMSSAARNLAALSDDNVPLLDGSKATADSISDLLELMMKAVDEPNTPGLLDALSAAEKQFVGAGLLSQDPKLAQYADKGAELLMLECIQDVDNNMEALGKVVANACAQLPPAQAQQLRDELAKMQNVKGFAVNNLKNMVPRVLEPQVQRQVEAANATLAKIAMDLVGKSKVAGVPQEFAPLLTDIGAAVQTSLKNLLESAKTAELRGIEGSLDIVEPTQELLQTLASLRSNISDPQKVINGVKSAAAAQNKVISVAKSLASGADPATKERLMNSSNNISKSVKDLMNDARDLVKSPNDLTLQGKVVADVGKLETQCQELLTDAGGITALNNLRFASKTTAAAIMKLATASNLCGPNVTDRDTRAELLASAKSVQGSLANLLSALQGAAKEPQNFVKQSELLEAARNNMPHYSDLASKSKKAARFVSDKNKQQDLSYASNETGDNLRMLMKAVSAVSDLGGQTDIEEALQEFDAVKADLEAAEFYAHQGLLTPIPGQTRENAQELLKLASDTLNKAIGDLTAAAKQGGKLPEHVKQAASGMAQVASAARSMASTISDRATQKRLIGAAKNLSENTLALISLGRSLAIEPQNAQKNQAMDQGRKTFDATLGQLLRADGDLSTKDIVKAIEDIQKEKGGLTKSAPTKMAYKDSSEALQGSGKALSAAVSQLIATARTNPQFLAASSKMTGATTVQLMKLASGAASSSPDQATADAILTAARNLADAMSKLLNTAQLSAVNRTPQAIQALSNGGQAVGSAIDELINSLGNATSPEAEQSINRIMNAISALDSGQLEVIPGNREDLLNEFLACAKDLARVTGSLVSSARVSASKLGLFSKEASSTVKNLLTTAKAATLSDGSSASMSLDGARIVKGADYIIENPEDTKRVLGCAKKITQAGSKLINNAKEFAKAEPDKNRRAAVVKNAQSVVNTATQLAQVSRDASTKKTPQSIQQLVNTAKQLKDFTIALEDSMRTTKPGEKSEENAVDPGVAQQLMTTSRTIAVATTGLIRASQAVSSNPDNDHASEDLKKSTRTVTEAIQNLIKVCGALNPGVQECEKAIQVIQTASADLDAATISSTIGNFQVPGSAGANLQQCQQDTTNVCKKLADDLKGLVNASGGSTKELVVAAQALQKSVPQLVSTVKLVAATTPDRNAQNQVLSLSKGVTDSFHELVKSATNVNVNDKQSVAHLNTKANETSESIGLLLGQLQSGVQLQADIDKVCKTIQTKLGDLGKPVPGGTTNYQETRDDLTGSAKELAAVVTNLLNVDKRNIGQVGLAATRVGSVMEALVDKARACVAATREQEAQKAILVETKNTGDNSIKMLQVVKAIVTGKNAVPQLRQTFNDVNTSISNLLQATRRGAVGEILMDRAIEAINKITTQLNTMSIFAQAGQMEADKSVAGLTMTKLQEELQQNCQKLNQAAAQLTKMTRAPDEELGKMSGTLAQVIGGVADAAKKTASKIADSVAQQEVLSSAKSLSIASHQLVLATKDVQRLPDDNTAQQTMTASLTAINECVNNLLTTVTRSSAESARSEKELEGSKQQIMALLKNVKPVNSNAEQVVEGAREVLAASAEVVFASNQGEVIQAGKASYLAIEKLLQRAAGASRLARNDQDAQAINQRAAQVAQTVCGLLETGKLNRQDEATQPKLEQSSGTVANSIQELVLALKKLPGTENLQIEDTKNDLDKVAEEELRKCAEIISAAAQTLLSYKPPPREKKIPGVLDQMDINEAIVNAAQAIATATGSLVNNAYDAQRERVADKAKAGGRGRYANDPTWANGLISASHSVAGSVQALVKSANQAAQGKAEEESLVASARAVASATAHLVSASKAKSDPNSKAQQSLGNAAKSVATATSQLVTAAGQAAQFTERDEEEDVSKFNFGSAGGKAKELEQQTLILKLEKELERERKRMLNMRKAKYQQT